MLEIDENSARSLGAVEDFSQLRLRIFDLSSALKRARSLVFKKYHMSILSKMQSGRSDAMFFSEREKTYRDMDLTRL